MKKWGRRLCALVMCALVMISAAPVARGATVYFMAVNDTFLDLNDNAMPTVVDGVLYIPYTMLSTHETGVNLNVYATYSSVKNRVLVFSNQMQLIFDLESDQTYDMDGNPFSGRAIMRNSMAYLPVALVCAVFPEISYSLTNTDYGYLVRVKNSSAVLTDAQYINAAANPMSSALARYKAAHPELFVTTPTNPVTPRPSIGSDAAVYLGFTAEDGSGLENVLNGLKSSDVQGVFFFTADQLARWDDLVRRIIGEGHFVGLLTAADDADAAAAELEEAQRILTMVAHCRGSAVLTPGLDDEGRTSLEEQGYTCWQTTADGRGLEGSAESRASQLMEGMTGGESARNYLLLDEGTGSLLESLLDELLDEDYQFRTPVATEF